MRSGGRRAARPVWHAKAACPVGAWPSWTPAIAWRTPLPGCRAKPRRGKICLAAWLFCRSFQLAGRGPGLHYCTETPRRTRGTVPLQGKRLRKSLINTERQTGSRRAGCPLWTRSAPQVCLSIWFVAASASRQNQPGNKDTQFAVRRQPSHRVHQHVEFSTCPGWALEFAVRAAGCRMGKTPNRGMSGSPAGRRLFPRSEPVLDDLIGHADAASRLLAASRFFPIPMMRTVLWRGSRRPSRDPLAAVRRQPLPPATPSACPVCR